MKLKPHAQNTNFQWRDRKGPFRLISTDQARAWNEEGFFLLRNVIPAKQISALIDAIDPFEQKTEQFLESRGGKMGISRSNELTFTIHLVARSKIARDFTRSALFSNLCLDLLGPDVRLYWDQAVYKKPGNPRDFPWHQDNGYNFVEPQDYLTCWIPLTDASVGNGCPWVIPGIHQQGTLNHWKTELGFECLDNPVGAVPVEVKAGDIVVFSSLTPHRTGPNSTTDIRKAYICQYAQDSAAMVAVDGTRTAQHDPTRQYLICRNGVAVDYEND